MNISINTKFFGIGILTRETITGDLEFCKLGIEVKNKKNSGWFDFYDPVILNYLLMVSMESADNGVEIWKKLGKIFKISSEPLHFFEPIVNCNYEKLFKNHAEHKFMR